VDLSGLAPLGSNDINYAEVLVYTAASSPDQLASEPVESDGSWSVMVPVSETQAVRIEARVYLKNGVLHILAWRQDTISGNTPGLDLAPAAVSLTGGQTVTRTSGYYEDRFLFVPSANGLFNLGAVSVNSTPYLAVYDAAAGTMLAWSNNGSLYAELAAETPYIVEVSNIGNFTAYQFQLSQALTPTSIGGSVNYSSLPGSISSAINSATVSGYLDNPANTQIVYETPVDGSGNWSATIPSLFAGQSARLVLMMHLNNGWSFNSHIEGVLPASNLDFAPTPVPVSTVINSRSAADGYDRLLFVPASNETFTLYATSNTHHINIYVYDGLTGSYIADSGYTYQSATLAMPLNIGNPYIIEIGLNGYFHGYQFHVEPVVSP
jgi:hypothetical protein